jgi:hypothetical protein
MQRAEMFFLLLLRSNIKNSIVCVSALAPMGYVQCSADLNHVATRNENDQKFLGAGNIRASEVLKLQKRYHGNVCWLDNAKQL